MDRTKTVINLFPTVRKTFSDVGAASHIERSYRLRVYARCNEMLAEDDCREDAHRRLMRCYSRQGQRNLALRQYHLCAETLARVLDVSPMQETVALYNDIRNQEVG